jgi:hypothetical protein
MVEGKIMTTFPLQQVTAFEGAHRIASGPLSVVAAKAKEVLDLGGSSRVLIFDDRTGDLVDLDFGQLQSPAQRRGVESDEQEPVEPRGVGRPRLGVKPREVTLLPRHWEWLGQQPGGASAVLRRLVDQARRESVGEESIRRSREALYRFMTAMAGDAPGYEEALRALFSGDAERFTTLTANWPEDVRDHTWKLAPPAFGYSPSPLDGLIPFAKREAIVRGSSSAFGGAEIESIARISKGASGAEVFRITVAGVDYLLRIEGPTDGLRDPVRHYACLKIASEAGVAPRLIYADAASGVAITGFIQTKSQAPKTANAAVLQAVATAVRDLHAAPLFPPLIDYLKGVDILIRRCQATGILEKRTVEKLLKFYGELAAAYPRRKLDVVSSHNDLNPGNLLFQKNKVWMIDWEAAFAADRYVDLAAITNFFTENEAAREIVLRTYFGAAVTDYQRARLFLMQQANRIFYAMVTFNFAAQTQPGIRLTAADFKSASWSGLRGEMAHPAIGGSKIRIACALLHDALREFQSGRFVKAIALVRHPPSDGSRKRR